MESDDESYTPLRIGLSFAVCYLLLSKQADDFQLLEDSGSSKHFIGPRLIHGIKSRMSEYIKTEPSMEIRPVGNSMLRGTAQGILPVVVHGTNNVLRKVKLTI